MKEKEKKEKEEKKNALNSVEEKGKKKKEKKKMKKAVDSGCGRLNLQRFRGGARYACRSEKRKKEKRRKMKKGCGSRGGGGASPHSSRWRSSGEAGQVQILAAGGARGRRGKSRFLPLAELGGGGASPQSCPWRSSGEAGQVRSLTAGGAREDYVDPGGWRGLFGRMHSRSRPLELGF